MKTKRPNSLTTYSQVLRRVRRDVAAGTIKLRRRQIPEDWARDYCRQVGIPCPKSPEELCAEEREKTCLYALALAFTLFAFLLICLK